MKLRAQLQVGVSELPMTTQHWLKMCLDDTGMYLNLTTRCLQKNMAILDTQTPPLLALMNQKSCLYLWADVWVALEAGSAILVQLVDDGHKHSTAMWHRTDWSGGSGPVSHDESGGSDYYDSRTICTAPLYWDKTNKQGLMASPQGSTCSIIGRDELLGNK